MRLEEGKGANREIGVPSGPEEGKGANREIGVPSGPEEGKGANREIDVPSGPEEGKGANREIGVPGMGTAPRPCFRRGYQACLYWILVDVFNCLSQVGFVAHKAVPILTVPDGIEWLLVEILKMSANLAGSELLPRGNNLRDGPRIDRPEKNVNVIRHYDPRQQMIMPRVKVQQ